MATAPQPYIPVEFQTELEKAARRQQIAQALFQNAMAPRQTEFVPGPYGRAVRQNPMEAVTRGLTGYLANRTMDQTTGQIADIRGRASAAEAEEAQNLTSLFQSPETRQAAIAQALASRNPRFRAMGENWQKMAHEGAMGAGRAAAEAGDVPGAFGIFRTSQVPGADYSLPKRADPKIVFQPTPDGRQIGMVVNEDKYGLKRGEALPAASSTNINLPGRTADLAFESVKQEIAARRTKADVAKRTLDSNRTAIDALERGAQAGGLEDWKQAIRKGAQAFGVNLPNVDDTNTLAMALGEGVLARIAELRPASDNDFQALKEIVGNITTDPGALANALMVANAIAFRDLQGYVGYLDATKTDLAKMPNADPNVLSLFAGADAGFRDYLEKVPVPGSAAAQMYQLQEMQKRGGDISRVTINGEPVGENARFQISPPRIGPGKASKETVRERPAAELTPTEKRILELEKQLGIQPR